jgi:hypothetical protein
VPCAGSLGKIEPLDWTFWVNRLSIARLERKTGKILTRLNQNKGDWEETLYQLLAESFGFKVNAEAFILLAESLPLNTLKRHGDDLFQLEALLLGQAGFLSEPSADPYINRLHNEYSFLSTKFNLYHLNAARIWKRFRMMPRNFPEIRIVQFAALLFKLNNLVTSLAEFEEAKDLFSVLHVKASSFWDGHYTMERISTPSCKKLGRTSIEGICINTIAPFVFCMGRYKGDLVLEERAITLLESCMPEKNQITKNWKRHGFVINNACESQGSIELKNEFCANKKCLDCVIGTKMLKTLNENG